MLFAAFLSAPDIAAIDLALTRPDLERALSIARWPSSDADRARFHTPYIVGIDDPAIDHWAVVRIEVITPFRRVVLMAEEHARANDLWGRGGLRDVEEAIQPWRDRVAFVVELRLRADRPYIGGVPPIEIRLGGPSAPAPGAARSTPIYANCGGDTTNCAIVGATAEFTFDAASIGQTARQVSIVWGDRQLTRVAIEFAQLR